MGLCQRKKKLIGYGFLWGHMPEIGRFLILIGTLIIAVGLVLTFAGKIPWLGRLPGDLMIQRKNVVVYIPIVTCLLLSLILTIVLNVLKR